MPNASFSVLIPACRAADTIEATLASVAAQSHPPAEVLVFEDGVFDDLRRRVESFAATAPFAVRLISSATNQGVSRARNRLLAEARGGFLAFLDADDLWETDHLARAAACFAAGADAPFSGVTFIDAAGRPIGRPSRPTAGQLADVAVSLYRYNFVQCTSTLAVRRGWIERVGPFDESLSHGEDLDLWLRLLAAGARLEFTGACSCRYRKHRGSAMAQTELMLERMIRFYEKHLGNPLLPRRVRRRSLSRALYHYARIVRRSRPARARAAAERLVQVAPWAPHHRLLLLALRWGARRTPAAPPDAAADASL